ncbi:MAG: SOS response-associated peptidase [Dehalococcoidia bacterium]
MCGRYTLALSPEMIANSFDISLDGFEFVPRYNIAPSQEVLTVTNRGEGNSAQGMRWGLVPFWAKDTKIGYKMINARAETVADNNAFKHAFRRRRCLIPADSFYEWRGTGKSKTPLRIMLKSEEPFAFAGIWETWQDKKDPTAGPLLSCSIITTVPNSLVEPIHNRMPVILPEELYAEWIDPHNEDTGALRELLLPYDPALMTAYEVSTLVNSPRNQGPEVAAPAAGQLTLGEA